DPESPALPAAVSADRRDARALGRVRPADRAGLRGAVEGADPRRARADDRRRGPHAALGAARGVRRGRDPLPRVTITVFGAGAIVSMQNGLNEELIAAAVGERRTVGCLVNWAADWMAPGRILHGGEGALVLGELDGRPSARVDALATLLEVVAPTRVSDNIL